MALVETVDPTDINLALANAFGDRLGWQIDRGELESRLDEAAYAVANILNRPYYEDDLTDAERAEAAALYEAQPYTTTEKKE